MCLDMMRSRYGFVSVDTVCGHRISVRIIDPTDESLTEPCDLGPGNTFQNLSVSSPMASKQMLLNAHVWFTNRTVVSITCKCKLAGWFKVRLGQQTTSQAGLIGYPSSNPGSRHYTKPAWDCVARAKSTSNPGYCTFPLSQHGMSRAFCIGALMQTGQ